MKGNVCFLSFKATARVSPFLFMSCDCRNGMCVFAKHTWDIKHVIRILLMGTVFMCEVRRIII